MRLTPTQRAALMIRLAYESGRGGPPVSRADLIARMFPAPVPAQSAPATSINVHQAHEDGGSDPAPVLPPGPPPDVEVSYADAAARLGVAVSTIKRYIRPSSGRLVRMGDGVSAASVEALRAA